MKLPFLVSDSDRLNNQINLTVKKVFIRRNIWDNYNAYIGTTKVRIDANKDSLIELCEIIYPNATIIDKTI